MPAGRPTKYDPSICADIPGMFTEGQSKAEVCVALGIGRTTMQRWEEEHEEFRVAIKAGEALSEAWWLQQGREALRDKEFSYTGWYMNMKNRFGWRDRHDHTTDGERMIPNVTIEHITPSDD